MIIIVNVSLPRHREAIISGMSLHFPQTSCPDIWSASPISGFQRRLKSLLKRATSTRILNTITFHSTSAMITKSRMLYRSATIRFKRGIFECVIERHVYIHIQFISFNFCLLKISNLRIFLQRNRFK